MVAAFKILFGLIIVCIIITLVNCRKKTSPKQSFCKIETNFFSIYTPCYATITDFKSVDSYAGKITIDSLSIIYDYGQYNNICMTEEEYILTNQWMPEVIDLLDLEKNKEYAIDTIINKIRIKNVDLTSHVITFIYNNKTFNYKITIPNSINKNIVFKDSIDNINRSFCLTPENINDNSFEISLLLTKIKEKKDNNNWVSLKLSARDVELKDTGFVLQILRTARISNRIGLK